MPPIKRVGPPPKKPTAKVADASTEKSVLAMLPSGRVAKLRVPRVKHAMAIREAAMVEAGIDPTSMPDSQDKSPEAEAKRTRALLLVNEAMERVSLRELLVGVSTTAPAIVFREGYPGEAALRVKFEAEAEAERAKAADEQRAPEPLLLDVEQRLSIDVSKAVDEQATAKSATIHPLTDLDWDNERGVIGELSNAYEGTDEARDWVTLHTLANKLLGGLRALGVETDGPKASAPRIRFSGGFVG